MKTTYKLVRYNESFSSWNCGSCARNPHNAADARRRVVDRARLYPFSGAFAEANLGGKFSWQEKVLSKNFTMGGSVGWRISSGRTYIEPKINFDYAFGAKEPFSWSGGVGAGYSF